MKINWFTVLAQAINFVVLVWLLKKFLYQPILNAIDERENKITGQLKDADNKKAAAQKEKDDFKNKNAQFDLQKKTLLNKAVEDASIKKNEIIETAKAEANTLKADMEQAAMEKEQRDTSETNKKNQQQVFAITRKALAAMATVSLEEQLASTFVKRLQASTEDEKMSFSNAFKASLNGIMVQSGFKLAAKQQGEINDAVNEILGTKTALQFKTTPEIISGIELYTNGYKVSWSFLAFMDSLEENIISSTKENERGVNEKNKYASK